MNSIKKIIVFSALILVSGQNDMKCMFDAVNNVSDKKRRKLSNSDRLEYLIVALDDRWH